MNSIFICFFRQGYIYVKLFHSYEVFVPIKQKTPHPLHKANGQGIKKGEDKYSKISLSCY